MLKCPLALKNATLRSYRFQSPQNCSPFMARPSTVLSPWLTVFTKRWCQSLTCLLFYQGDTALSNLEHYFRREKNNLDLHETKSYWVLHGKWKSKQSEPSEKENVEPNFTSTFESMGDMFDDANSRPTNWRSYPTLRVRHYKHIVKNSRSKCHYFWPK